ncbi:MAG: RNA methyltransferase [bacterium]
MTAQIFPMEGIRPEHIAVVLVSPKNPGNIGSVARALKNMGLRDLRLVNPWPRVWLEAIRMACGAEDLLEEAQVVATLEEALIDIQWAVGTTARTRRYHKDVFTPREIAGHIASLSQSNKVAFLFGSEKCGLTTEELSCCHQVVTIPTQKQFSSLNLAQAVLIMAWELSQVRRDGSRQKNRPALVSHRELHDLFLQIGEVLTDLEFINPENSRHMMLSIKNILNQKYLTNREVKILRGILRQISYKLSLSHAEIKNYTA